MINPICEVRVDTIIDKRRTHRGIAIAVLVNYKDAIIAVMYTSKNFPRDSS